MLPTLRKDFDGMIRIMRLTNDRYTIRHYHDYLEFAYIFSGEAEHRLGNNASTTLTTGDYFIIDYDTAHDYFSEKQNLTIINCLFLPEFINDNFAGIKSFDDLCERYFLRIAGRKINAPTSNQVFKDDGIIGELFLKLYDEYTQKRDGYLEIMRCVLCEIIIETVRKVGSRKHMAPITTHILEVVDENYSEPLNLSAICKEKFFSLPYASMRFKDDMGITFTEHLQNRRIEEACRLLIDTNNPISRIGEAVGYKSTKFFNKIFKQVTKITPSEYRRNYKK